MEKKVLVTGYRGFLGKNLCAKLKEYNLKFIGLEKSDKLSSLQKEIKNISFIFHFAGSNRPKNEKEFETINHIFTKEIISLILINKLKIPILFSSSIQAVLRNKYGVSKKKAEDEIRKYHKITGAPVYIYRLPNIFGKWGKPDYNSVISTFCYKIARREKIFISDPEKIINLSYVDDVIDEMLSCMDKKKKEIFLSPKKSYSIKIGKIAKKIIDFRNSRKRFFLPNISDDFSKKLYSTYLSYLPKENFSYPLNEKKDSRGKFVEVLKTKNKGQISVSYSNGGVLRGNHYHNTKVEKFLVLKGKAKVKFRKILEKETFEYVLSDKKLEIIDIPPGYTHSIENTGKEEMILLIWANETFNKKKSDTYFQQI